MSSCFARELVSGGGCLPHTKTTASMSTISAVRTTWIGEASEQVVCGSKGRHVAHKIGTTGHLHLCIASGILRDGLIAEHGQDLFYRHNLLMMGVQRPFHEFTLNLGYYRLTKGGVKRVDRSLYENRTWDALIATFFVVSQLYDDGIRTAFFSFAFSQARRCLRSLGAGGAWGTTKSCSFAAHPTGSSGGALWVVPTALGSPCLFVSTRLLKFVLESRNCGPNSASSRVNSSIHYLKSSRRTTCHMSHRMATWSAELTGGSIKGEIGLWPAPHRPLTVRARTSRRTGGMITGLLTATALLLFWFALGLRKGPL